MTFEGSHARRCSFTHILSIRSFITHGEDTQLILPVTGRAQAVVTLLPPDGGDDDDDDDYVNCDDVDENNEECSDYPRLNAWTLKLNTWLRAADRLLYAYGWQAQ